MTSTPLNIKVAAKFLEGCHKVHRVTGIHPMLVGLSVAKVAINAYRALNRASSAFQYRKQLR